MLDNGLSRLALVLLAALFAAAFAVAACDDGGDGDGDADGDTDTDTDTDSDTDTDTDSDTDSDGDGDGDVVEVSGDIATDTTWTADHTYVLTNLAFVTDAVLTIEAGTEIRGRSGSALIVTRTGRIEASGTASAPIVFTSDKDPGERRRGDWGGLVLLGGAPMNLGADGHIEGIESSDERGIYGGTDAAHDCGTLEYVRIEFAGYELSLDNELNGLTVGACGSDTTIDHLQVHMGDDDGVEFFGGTASMTHVVVSGAADDSVDWDEGWQGTVQFLIVQQYADEADSGFESDNLESNNDAAPRSQPQIYNATMVGPNDPAGSQRGMVLRRGTWGVIRNAILMGFANEAIDVRDAATVAGTEESPIALTVESSIFFEIGSDGSTWFSDEPTDGSEDDDDDGFVEEEFFTASARGNRFGDDPQLSDPYNLDAPGFVPDAGSPAATGGATPPSGFDTNATYVGAIEPGGTDWTAGWTSYPAD